MKGGIDCNLRLAYYGCHSVRMKSIFLVCCILCLVLTGLSCAPTNVMGISISGLDDSVIIENVGGTDCPVSVSSLECEQQF